MSDMIKPSNIRLRGEAREPQELYVLRYDLILPEKRSAFDATPQQARVTQSSFGRMEPPIHFEAL
jgi:hypothetical protein